MAERSALNQVVQIGVESTPGTSVAAGRRLQAIGIEPSPSVEMDQFRPMGQKYRAITTLGKEWVEASISGRGSYTELVYLLSSVVDTATIATPGGATDARTWTFTPDSFDDDVPKTFTVEHGSGVRADKLVYGLVTELGMAFNRSSIEVSGSMMGRAIEDGITLTGSPTTVDLIPIIPTQVSVYMDDASGDLGTTKLTRVISADFSLGSRYAGVWVLDAANPSFVNHIESEPDLSLNLTLQADAEGMALLTNLRDSETKFIRIHAVGVADGIEAGYEYEFTLDLAGKISDTGGFSDQDGVYAIEFNFVGVHDATWGKAYEFILQNALTAL
jgi:hypothetical protein